MDQNESQMVPRRLLLACARVRPNQEARAAIRHSPFEDLDWTLFARLATDSGLAGLVGHTLDCVVPERVPDDILHALRVNQDDTRRRNRGLLVELARIVEALADAGVEPIPFRGPVLATQIYSDLGFRAFRNLDLLVRDPEVAPTMATLRRLGYERRPQLSAAQLDLIARLQGRETVVNKSRGIDLVVHMRLPITMPLDIDYGALWRRARCTTLNGRTVGTLSPEDELLMLAIHGGEELWGSIGWACDIEAFIDSHPHLDWVAIRERARGQGCLRMVLLTTALARRYFGGAEPGWITAADRSDRTIEPIVRRVVAHWFAAKAVGVPRRTGISLDRLQLHDDFARRCRYVARTMLLPAPHHVARIRLPEGFTSLGAYVPLKLGQDLALLPLSRVYRHLRAQAERLRDAFGNYRFALALLPVSAETRRRLRQQHKARAEATRALAANPNDPATWHRLGNALAGLRRYEEAIACYEKALAIAPDNGRFWRDRRAAVGASKTKTAPSDIQDESTLDPQDANAWARRAGFLAATQRHREASAASDRALAIDPKHFIAMRVGIKSRIAACDWHRREEDKRCITRGLKTGLPIITPFNHRAISESEAEHLVVARLFARNLPRSKTLWLGEIYRHRRIRVAYLSANFNKGPVAMQVAGVFEHHDKTRFETIACSFGPDDRSVLRRRIEAAMDHFIDAQAMDDAEVAAKLRAMEVDIAVDLNGYTGAGRTAVLAHRPCPVQVNYFVNVGTMGAAFVDYIIADRTVIPSENFQHYTEKIVYLPHSYQCNDSRRFVPQHVPSRVDAGLPEAGFVYCCFNNNYKIAPAVFDVWMRLLTACPGSVLWLLGDNPCAMSNLRLEAAVRGVAAERLVFAPRMPEEDHLARLRLAGLFLDTLPVNANATASDALWAGLPVLTCIGDAFAGRVAASMLRAIGLPELVTSSLAEYEELALALARDRERLAAIKSKLGRNRDTEPLFDTLRYTSNLEAAYTVMCERSRRGEPPENISVPSPLRSTEMLGA